MIKEKKVRKKSINSKDKGNRFERIVCNKFKKAWDVTAYRTPGSGAYTSRAVSKAMKEAAMGDVVIEELPEFVIECKNYYSLHQTNWFKEDFKGGSIWNFWIKLNKEAEDFKKIPLLICKEANSPIIVIVDNKFFSTIESYTGNFNTYFTMRKKNVSLKLFKLNELLELDLETMKLIVNNV